LEAAEKGTEEEKALLEELGQVNRRIAEETRRRWVSAFQTIAGAALDAFETITGGLDSFSSKTVDAIGSFIGAAVSALSGDLVGAFRGTMSGILGMVEAYMEASRDKFREKIRQWRQDLFQAFETAQERLGGSLASIFEDYFLRGEGDLRARLQGWVKENIVKTIIDTMVQGLMSGLRILPEVEYWAKMLAQVLRGASLEELKTMAEEVGVFSKEELRRYQGTTGRRALGVALKDTIQTALRSTVQSAMSVIDRETGMVVRVINDVLGETGLAGVQREAATAQTEIEKAAASLGQAITATQGNILISLWQTATGYLESINRGVWTIANRITVPTGVRPAPQGAEQELGLERAVGLGVV